MSKLLLVEDDDQVAEIFTEGLVQAGHQVERAAEAYAALKLVMDEEFDLAIMDLVIPTVRDVMISGVNGVLTAAALRGVGFAGPIVALTGNALPVAKEIADRVGFTGYLLKPVRVQHLVDEIARQLEGHR